MRRGPELARAPQTRVMSVPNACKHSCKSVPNECKKAPSVGEDAFGKFYVNARSLTRRVRGTCW